LLVLEAEDGTVRDATSLQPAGALDDLYAGAAKADDLGVTVGASDAGFKLWAPTAQNVAVCTPPAAARPPPSRRCGATTPPASGPRALAKTASTTNTLSTWSRRAQAWCATWSPILIPSA
jgi:hypothetical protein